MVSSIIRHTHMMFFFCFFLLLLLFLSCRFVVVFLCFFVVYFFLSLFNASLASHENGPKYVQTVKKKQVRCRTYSNNWGCDDLKLMYYALSDSGHLLECKQKIHMGNQAIRHNLLANHAKVLPCAFLF